MELRHLSAFNAVAEELHFGKAAQRIFLSQSALSRVIRQLEIDLGVTLLDRTSHRVELTAAGKRFLDESRAALLQIDAAVARAREEVAVAGRALKVGCDGTTGTILARAAARFAQRHGDARLEVHAVDGDPAEAVRCGAIDVLLTRVTVDHRALCCEPVGEDPVVGVVAANHAAAEKTVALDDLGAECRLIVARRTCPRVWTDLMRQRPTANVEDAPSLTAAVVRAAAGAGVALIPRSCVPGPALPEVLTITLTPPFTAPVLAVWRAGDGSALIGSLVESLAALVSTWPHAGGS